MPFMPGIDQSMTTTSGASVSIGEKHASAELASPTTATSGRAASSALIVRRMTALSSTTKIFTAEPRSTSWRP